MNGREDLGWLLTRFGKATPGVIVTAVVSVDGLLVAASEGLDEPTAETVAALTSSLASVSRGASPVVDGGTLHKVLVAYDNGFLLLTSLREGAVLSVLARSGSDVSFIGSEMMTLGDRVGTVLSPALLQAARARAAV
ncbi:MAG TPA: roadblock/LC7 domain-containing protein [Euzebya sp.]|nr:roadblock/LC7 domain-containing protein [Euzebya sp.]